MGIIPWKLLFSKQTGTVAQYEPAHSKSYRLWNNRGKYGLIQEGGNRCNRCPRRIYAKQPEERVAS